MSHGSESCFKTVLAYRNGAAVRQTYEPGTIEEMPITEDLTGITL